MGVSQGARTSQNRHYGVEVGTFLVHGGGILAVLPRRAQLGRA
jgi:hypothetical protein